MINRRQTRLREHTARWKLAICISNLLLVLSACSTPPPPQPTAREAAASRRSATRQPPAANPAEFISSITPSWIRYSDRAGVGADKREQASENDFRSLKATGLERIRVPLQLSGSQFPVDVDGVLGETVLQFECEGACEGVMISVRSPDNRGTVVRVDTHLAFPLLRIRNPTMYPQTLEVDAKASSKGAPPFQIKLTQWRYYLWSR